MKIAKNMEALFAAAAVLVCSATYASVAVPNAHDMAAIAPLPSITITAKRLSAHEKADASLQESVYAGIVSRFSI